jgi:hypothetical protein
VAANEHKGQQSKRKQYADQGDLGGPFHGGGMVSPNRLTARATGPITLNAAHSTIALTADTYAAVLPSLQRAAAERLAAFVG